MTKQNLMNRRLKALKKARGDASQEFHKDKENTNRGKTRNKVLSGRGVIALITLNALVPKCLTVIIIVVTFPTCH